MSLDALKKEAASLDEASRKELVNFLVALAGKQRAERARHLATIRDDKDPNRWLTSEEFKERLDRSSLGKAIRMGASCCRSSRRDKRD